ncbi:MAG: extracellular solute-binding protein [Acutalibacteraceae bacterium]
MTKRILCFIISTILLLSVLSGCKSSDKAEISDNLTYYKVKDSWSGGESWIYDYNKNCDDEDKIEIVEFESVEALKNRLTTELMSGGGPDIMNEATFLSADLSIEKLIDIGAFMDLNELIESDNSDDKIEFTEQNQKALECGVADGKRFCIPLYYMPNFLMTTQEKCSKYMYENTLSLSYDALIDLYEKISSESGDKRLYKYSDSSNLESLLISCIDSNIDLVRKTSELDTEKFKETVIRIDKLIKKYADDTEDDSVIDMTEETDPDSYIFEDMIAQSPYDIYSSIVYTEQRGDTPIIVGTPSSEPDTLSANITESVFVNKNCTKKEKVLKAIKFAMSEETQSKQVGAEIDRYDPMFAAYSGNLFPVNNKAFEKLMNTADSFSYNTKDSYYEGDDDGIPDDDKEQAAASDESKKMLHNALESISSYELDTYLYFNTQVIYELFQSYLKNEITVDKFISDLRSKTKIYLEE